MSDAVIAFLLAAAGPGPGLLVLDENAATPPRPPTGWRAVTNRIDVALAARAAGWDCECNDFRIDAGQDLSRVACRVSKEKRVAEHVLDALWAALAPGGELWLAGYKQEGVKTLAQRAAQAWSSAAVLTRGDGGLHLYRFVRGTAAAARLCPVDYHALVHIGERDGAPLWSKPGVFAWDRVDAGTELLLQHLPEALAGRDLASTTAVDLGCGYGLLAQALLKAGCAHVIATDSNAAAVEASRQTLAAVADPARYDVRLDDCAATLDARADLVVCNPPFHQGFAVESSLTDRFLDAARRLLAPQGVAVFVVNAFIPLERKAAATFADVEVLANDRRFKVLALRPRATVGRGGGPAR